MQQGRRNLGPQPISPISKFTPSMEHIASIETIRPHPTQLKNIPSVTRGVIPTLTAEIITTPSPAELISLFKHSPKVELNFRKIFNFEEGDSGEKGAKSDTRRMLLVHPPSLSSRGRKVRIRIGIGM